MIKNKTLSGFHRKYMSQTWSLTYFFFASSLQTFDIILDWRHGGWNWIQTCKHDLNLINVWTWEDYWRKSLKFDVEFKRLSKNHFQIFSMTDRHNSKHVNFPMKNFHKTTMFHVEKFKPFSVLKTTHCKSLTLKFASRNKKNRVCGSDEEHKNICKWHKFQVKSFMSKKFRFFCGNRINHHKNDDTIACQLRLGTSLWICNSMFNFGGKGRGGGVKIWQQKWGTEKKGKFHKIPKTFVKF